MKLGSSTKIPFTKSPTYLFGLSGEKEIGELLKKHGAYIIPKYEYNESNDNKGPGMHGISDELILPDLDVCKNRTRVWVEVKTKTECTLHDKTGDFLHGFKKRHYDDYLRVEATSGNEVWVVFIERTTGRILCGRLVEIPIHHIYRGDLMDKGGTVFFDIKYLDPLSTLIERLCGVKDDR